MKYITQFMCIENGTVHKFHQIAHTITFRQIDKTSVIYWTIFYAPAQGTDNFLTIRLSDMKVERMGIDKYLYVK